MRLREKMENSGCSRCFFIHKIYRNNQMPVNLNNTIVAWGD